MFGIAPLESYYWFHLIIAAIAGLLIGFEREISGKDPGLRTFALICLGSCLFTLLSVEAAGQGAKGDAGRVAAQIVTGIGFIGAGTIFRSPRGVSGLTTAALMWVTAAIGMAIGYNKLDLALMSTVIVLFVLVVIGFVHKIRRIKGEG